MTLKLTPEQRVALRSRSPGSPVILEDEESREIYLLVTPDDAPSLWSEYLRAEVDVGLAAIDRGEIVEWDPEAMKQRARDAAKQ